jgi:formylglycine-generating enzyme required for sulfatase activity
VTWYEAFAFCAWDGGFLPTQAEFHYAASGGAEQRAYPWSTPADSLIADCAHANYFINSPTGDYCVKGSMAGLNAVGSEPAGDGKWGQSDLAGNVWEWNLDSYSSYLGSCENCVDLTASSHRVFHGGGFLNLAPLQRATFRSYLDPTHRAADVGFRCARAK